MNKTLALMAAASVVAFAASANAYEFTPYVAADYTYTDTNFADVNGGKVALGTEYNKYFGKEAILERYDKKILYFGRNHHMFPGS